MKGASVWLRNHYELDKMPCPSYIGLFTYKGAIYNHFQKKKKYGFVRLINYSSSSATSIFLIISPPARAISNSTALRFTSTWSPPPALE